MTTSPQSPPPVEQIAAVIDHGGRAIIIGVDCDAITIGVPHNSPYILDAPAMAAFERAWGEAGQRVRAWPGPIDELPQSSPEPVPASEWATAAWAVQSWIRSCFDQAGTCALCGTENPNAHVNGCPWPEMRWLLDRTLASGEPS